MKRLLTILFALLMTIPQCIQAQTKLAAFPGAEGYGKYVTGGRGGEVCYVTRLDDCSDTNLVPGTLRWALRHNNGGKPRTVLFNVSGTIYLTSKLKLEYPDVSILGQSAPGGGICISGFNMYICKNNVIVRYVRFRAGDIPNSSMTGLDMENCRDIILDHCSMTWSMEECLTAYDTKYSTIQWCIIGEGLYSSKNAKGSRAYAMQWGGEHSTMHHTLITNSHSRSPRFNGVRSYSTNRGDHDYEVDSEFANNVIFNWSGTGAIYGGEYDPSKAEKAGTWTDQIKGYNRVYMINNFYKPGPSTMKNNTQTMFASPSSPYGQWYANGNKFEETGTYCSWTQAAAQAANSNNMNALNGLPADNKLSEIPYALSGMTYESADNAYNAVVTKAGASLPRYDEVDQRLLDEAAGKRAPQYTGSLGEAGIIDAPDDVKLSNPGTYYANGVAYHNYPSLALKAGEKYMIDSDCDGMPDAYEDEKGLNKNNAADGAAVAANGYTNLENYLNGIADGTISKAKYETSTVPVKPGTNQAPETVTVTFRCADAAVKGTLPENVTLKYGESIAIPQNTTLYKEGYTLSTWQGNGYTLGAGNELMPLEDIVLTPVFVQNTTSIAQRKTPVYAIWKGGKNSTATLLVTQAKVEGSVIDVAINTTDGSVYGYAFEKENSSVENDLIVLFPTTKSTEGISGSGEGTLTWEWAGLTAGEVADKAAANPEAAFTSVKASLIGLSPSAKNVSGKACLAFNPSAKESSFSTSNKNYIEFTITPAAGMKFKATKISWNGAFCGTGGGIYAITTQVGTGTLQTQASGIAASRDALKAYSYDLTKTTLSDTPTKVRIYIYSLDTGKQGVIRDVVITGTYEGASSGSQEYYIVAKPYTEGSGTITIAPEAETFAAGKTATLTATPNDGFLFDSWVAADGTQLSTSTTVNVEVKKTTLVFAVMKPVSDYDYIYQDCAPYDAAVDNINGLKLALASAAKRSDLTKRYRILLKNGTYDFGKTALTAVVQNTSLIGESQEGVLIMNNPGSVGNYQQDTPVLFIDQNQNNVYMQDLTIRQARDWDAKKANGQCIALRQRGKFAAYKNVTLQGMQDTYYINKADASAYFEDCTLAGEVDFIYGDGTLFFQNCTLNPVSASAVITASNAQPGYMGMVFNDCTIDGASGYALGRPWGDSPAVTYLNTTMKAQPQAAGWKGMTSGCVLRFHEFGSMDATGKALDLSARSISACGGAAGSDAPVINAEAAKAYTLENTFAKWADWKPAEATAQVTAKTPVLMGTTLAWEAADGAIGYAVCKDGKVVMLTDATSCTVDDAKAIYTVRAVSQMGGMGKESARAEVMELLPGDADADGRVTIADANLVVNHFLGSAEVKSAEAADINKDNKITIGDANEIVNVFLSK